MNMNQNNIESGSRLSRCIKASFRVLRRARDSYVNGMTGYADRMRCGGTPFHRSFSVSSSRASEDEDLRALMRAVSWRRQEERSETGAGEAMGSKGLPKSFSAGIGRIDEDEPCYFQEDLKVNSHVPMYSGSRSRRSYAVSKRPAMLG